MKLVLLCHFAGEEVKWGEIMRLAKATLGGEAGCPSGLLGRYCLEKLGPDLLSVVRIGVGFVKVPDSNSHN